MQVSHGSAGCGHAARTAPSPGAGANPSLRKRVLIVDDDALVRGSLAAVLAQEGFIVEEAQNGAEAVACAAVRAPDLVLLDLKMPVKNGWDTFGELTCEHPFVPVIIVTARPNQFFTALGAGVGALMEKPMDIPALLRTIAMLLAESHEARLERLAGHRAAFYYNSGRSHHPADGSPESQRSSPAG